MKVARQVTVLVTVAITAASCMGSRVAVEGDVPYFPDRSLDVLSTAGRGRPIVLLFHGAGLDRSDYTTLARALALDGALVLNVEWSVNSASRGTDEAICALLWASDHAVEYGGDPDRLYVVAHSTAVARTAAVVTDPDARGASCDDRTAPPVIGFVGIAPTRSIGPVVWPPSTAGEESPTRIRLVTGTTDPLGPERISQNAVEALRRAGYDADLVVVEGGHLDLVAAGEADLTPAAGATLEAIRAVIGETSLTTR